MLALELWDISRPITLLKMGVGSPFLVKFPLMEVLNVWAFLTSTEPVGHFGMPISWLPILVGDTVVPPPIRTRKFNLGDLMEVFPYRGVVPSLPIRLMSPGFRKTGALLRTASVSGALSESLYKP